MVIPAGRSLLFKKLFFKDFLMKFFDKKKGENLYIVI